MLLLLLLLQFNTTGMGVANCAQYYVAAFTKLCCLIGQYMRGDAPGP